MAIACIPQTTLFADISYTRMLEDDPIDDSALQNWKGVAPPAKFITIDVRDHSVPGQTIVD